jgi:hypothetical protein
MVDGAAAAAVNAPMPTMSRVEIFFIVFPTFS